MTWDFALRPAVCSCLIALTSLLCRAETRCVDMQMAPDGGALACKPMPTDGSRYIVVTGSSVKIVDAESRRTLMETEIDLDSAWGPSILIDTAPYKLTPAARAFGIRYNYAHHDRDVSESDQLLNLYIVDGDHIKEIVKGLVANVVILNSGCDDGGTEPAKKCHPGRDEINRTIQLGPGRHKGFADIHVREGERQCEDGSREKVPCAVLSKQKFTHKEDVVLSYDGEKYAVPEGLDNGVLLQW